LHGRGVPSHGLRPRDSRVRMSSCRLILPVAALLTLAPVAGQAQVAATWKRHEIEFTYMGFTTRYSCEGLRSKLRLLLQASGARPDFAVNTRSCASGPGEMAEFPRVQVVFHVPEMPPAGNHVAGESTAARWKKVDLRRHQPTDLEIGDCELVEQFRDRVLAAFTTRNLVSEINCIPHQLAGSSFRLEYEVLVGLPSAENRPPVR
jgi:hypothetical protein